MSSPHHPALSTVLNHSSSSVHLTPHLAHNTSNNSSSNSPSSISITPSTTSGTLRKAHHPPLEAIQTQKAQASVTFRPVSSTSAEIEGEGSLITDTNGEGSGSGLTPYSPFPSHPDQLHQPPPDHRHSRDSMVVMTTFADPPLNTASTGNGSFPFTPSTLVETEVPSPGGVNGYQNSQSQGTEQSRTISRSPTRPERIITSRTGMTVPLGPQQQQHQQQLHQYQYEQQHQQQLLQPRASSSRRQQRQSSHLGIGTGTSTSDSMNRPRPRSTSSKNAHTHNNKRNVSSTSKQQDSQGMDLTYSSSSDDPRFQHLPNLWQVLHRKTQPPVCLFNFYLYMRDDEKSSEEVDFWLDVTAHEVLWRLYVRATKRRMAIAEREMKLERGKAAQEELAMEAAYAAEVAALGIADLEGKSAHKKQPSVTLDMYEPHWSAANRYLEMSSPEGSSIIDPACNTSTNPSSPTTPQQHRSLTRQYLDDASQSNASSDQILMVHNALRNPISPPVGHFPVAANRIQLVRLPGAVPASWIHPSEMETQGGTDSNISEGTPTGALPSTPAAKASLIAKDGKTSGHGLRIAMSIGENIEANDISATTKSMTTAGKLSTGSDVGPRSVTAGANSSYQRAVTSGNGGVTKEDLIKSAERIYCKYLIPQAEKRVRIPGSVRKRVALLMDPLLLDRENKQPSTITCTVSDGQSGGAGPSSPVLKSKNNWGSSRISATPPQHGLILSNSDLLNEKSDKSKNSSISEPTSSRLSSSTNNNKEKQIKRQLSSTSLDRTASASGASPTLQQPDQDIGLAFAEAREIVFEGMESYYFPRFLKARAYGNMVPSHRLMRAIVGLLCLFVGFSIVLTLIFLDVRPRSYRALAMVPISVGTFLCTTFQFNICPVIAAAGVSETGFWRYAKVKEPYLMKLHRQRGVKVVVVAVLYTICVGLVFGLVPGHRL